MIQVQQRQCYFASVRTFAHAGPFPFSRRDGSTAAVLGELLEGNALEEKRDKLEECFVRSAIADNPGRPQCLRRQRVDALALVPLYAVVATLTVAQLSYRSAEKSYLVHFNIDFDRRDFIKFLS